MRPQHVGELHVLHHTSRPCLTSSRGWKGLAGRWSTVPHMQDSGVPRKVSAVLGANAWVDISAAEPKHFKTRLMEGTVAPRRPSCRCAMSPCFSSGAVFCISPFQMWDLDPSISLPSATSIPDTSLSKGDPVSVDSTNPKFQAQWAGGYLSKVRPGVALSH